MFQQVNEPVEKSMRWSTVQPPFQSVIAKCMAKSPQQRYTSAAALKDDIELLKTQQSLGMEGKPIKSQSLVSRTAHGALSDRPRSKVKIAAIGALVTTMLGIGLLYFSRSHTGRDTAQIVTPYEVIRSFKYRRDALNPSELNDLASAVEAYKSEPELDKPALASAYIKLMSNFTNLKDFNRVRSLGRQCLSVVGYPAQDGCQFVAYYHDACVSTNCELSLMPVLEEGLRRYRKNSNRPQVALIEARLASDYLELGRVQEAAVLLGGRDQDLRQKLLVFAGSYDAKARYSQSEPLYKRALAMTEKSSGLGNEDLRSSLFALADNYRMQAKHFQAEPLYKRSLEIAEKNSGSDSANELLRLTLLCSAENYRALAKYSQAEPLYKRSLKIAEKSLRFKNENLRRTLFPLADNCYHQAIYSQAEVMYKRALSMAEKLGPAQNDMGPILVAMANNYREQRSYFQAEQLYKRNLAIIEKKSGLETTDLILPMAILANTYDRQAKYLQAEPLNKRALVIAEKSRNQSTVANTLNWLALHYVAQRRYDSAVPLLKQALKLYEQVRAPQQTNCRSELAKCYKMQGKLADAQRLSMPANGQANE